MEGFVGFLNLRTRVLPCGKQQQVACYSEFPALLLLHSTENAGAYECTEMRPQACALLSLHVQQHLLSNWQRLGLALLSHGNSQTLENPRISPHCHPVMKSTHVVSKHFQHTSFVRKHACCVRAGTQTSRGDPVSLAGPGIGESVHQGERPSK